MNSACLFHACNRHAIERRSGKQHAVSIIGGGNGQSRTHDARAEDQDRGHSIASVN
jgi:hypothetical protein